MMTVLSVLVLLECLEHHRTADQSVLSTKTVHRIVRVRIRSVLILASVHVDGQQGVLYKITNQFALVSKAMKVSTKMFTPNFRISMSVFSIWVKIIHILSKFLILPKSE